jgi:hypothetical protein
LDIGFAAPAQQRGIDHLGPVERVSHQGSAQGEDIVQRLGDDFGGVKGSIFGDVEDEFGGGFGAARVEEVKVQAVDFELSALGADGFGGFHIADRTAG